MDKVITESKLYSDNGFFISDDALIPESMLTRAISRVQPILDGEYDMGFPPSRRWNANDENKVQKIDQVHYCDQAFLDIVTYSKLFNRVAEVVGAKTLQVWGTQLLIKPSGGGVEGNIGWHSDEANWHWLSGELFTIWIPLVDVSKKSGTICYIEKSHKWNLDLKVEDAYNQNMKCFEEEIENLSPENDFSPVYVEIPKGSYSIHDKRTLHGSYENNTAEARICLAINVRTEKSKFIEEKDDVGLKHYINNPVFSPVVYHRPQN